MGPYGAPAQGYPFVGLYTSSPYRWSLNTQFTPDQMVIARLETLNPAKLCNRSSQILYKPLYIAWASIRSVFLPSQREEPLALSNEIGVSGRCFNNIGIKVSDV